MRTEVHRSLERGEADYGWLKARYSFSFAQYHNPNRIHFGVLRVLNDDCIAAGRGFDTHPHDNMEIVTIPLRGELTHKDSMGHEETIKAGEVQVMSAGTGIYHSEYNAHQEEACELFQIWFLPESRNVTPRYDQAAYDQTHISDDWAELVHPKGRGNGLWIHQDVWIHKTFLGQGRDRTKHLMDASHGLFIMVVSGEIKVGEHILHSRDELQIRDAQSVEIQGLSDAEILTIEVPLSLPRIR